jgi:RNA polymerase sigma factor (TIGR02999 family)
VNGTSDHFSRLSRFKQIGSMSTERDAVRTGELLTQFRSGNVQAAQELIVVLYDELHRIAQAQMRSETGPQTLQPTALISELSLKMFQQKGCAHDPCSQKLTTEGDFLSLARYLMAQVLIEHARRKASAKRSHVQLPLDEARCAAELQNEQVDTVMDTLARLEQEDPALSKIVELRFLCGYSIEETARALGCGPTKIKAESRLAKLWLQRELRDLCGVQEHPDCSN